LELKNVHAGVPRVLSFTSRDTEFNRRPIAFVNQAFEADTDGDEGKNIFKHDHGQYFINISRRRMDNFCDLNFISKGFCNNRNYYLAALGENQFNALCHQD
jgi:hypothetical protein